MVSQQNLPPEFSPADIAAVAGVPVSLQREWRRQEILPKKDDRGWTRVTIDELARIFVLKRLADAGFTLKQAERASHEAVKPLLRALEERAASSSDPEDVSAFFKKVLVSENQGNERGNRFAKKESGSRYLIFFQDSGEPSGPVHILPATTLSEVPDNLIVWTALDHKRAAEHIAKGVLDRRGPGMRHD